MRAKAILVCAFLLFSAISLLAATYKELHAFDFNGNANTPFAGLVFDQTGKLYGVAAYGLDYTEGTIFELSHSGSWRQVKNGSEANRVLPDDSSPAPACLTSSCSSLRSFLHIAGKLCKMLIVPGQCRCVGMAH